MIMQVHNDINTANIQCVEADTSDTADASDISRVEAFDGVYFRGRFGYTLCGTVGGYRMNPHEIRRFKIRRQHISEEFEYQQFDQGFVYGADGSIIEDGDDVYLLEGRFQDRVTKIDYFHGFRIGVPTAQLRYDDEALALNMVQLGWWGESVYCLTVLQRKWRNRRWRLCVLPGLIQLAKDMLKPICKTSRSLRHTSSTGNNCQQQQNSMDARRGSGVLVIDSNGVVR